MKKAQNNINIDTTKQYSVSEAVPMLKQLSQSKFVGSVDVDILLNLSEKQKKDTVSGTLVLPNKFGKEVRVAVIAEGEDQTKAKNAGADLVGLEDLIGDIDKGVIDFDVLIATPNVMRHMAKLGKVLGPRNLMPSPKNETVTADVTAAVSSYKAGKLAFKSSEQQTVRTKVGQLDMSDEAIVENVVAFVKAVREEAKNLNAAAPFKKVTIKPTMGKSLKIDWMQL